MPSFLNSLWVKLTAAFLLVSLSAVALVAIWLGQTTTTAFQHFLAEEQMGQWTAVRDAVQADYAATGSWQNTPALLENGRIQGQGWLMVEDNAGQLVASVGSGGMGHGRSSATHATRLPLVVAGETIGYLLVPDGNMASMMAGHAQQFLAATRREPEVISLPPRAGRFPGGESSPGPDALPARRAERRAPHKPGQRGGRGPDIGR